MNNRNMKKSERLGVVLFIVGIPMYFVIGHYNIILGFIAGLLLGDWLYQKLVRFYKRFLLNQPKEEGCK
jgi:hypothetical protein